MLARALAIRSRFTRSAHVCGAALGLAVLLVACTPATEPEADRPVTADATGPESVPTSTASRSAEEDVVASLSPSPSPSGPVKVALVLVRAGDLVGVRLDGTEVALTTGPEKDLDPVVTEDGSAVVFTRRAGAEEGPGTGRLQRAPLDAGPMPALTDLGPGFTPAISGGRLARGVPGEGDIAADDIVLGDLEGGTTLRLELPGQAPYATETLRWDADGRHLYLESCFEGCFWQRVDTEAPDGDPQPIPVPPGRRDGTVVGRLHPTSEPDRVAVVLTCCELGPEASFDGPDELGVLVGTGGEAREYVALLDLTEAGVGDGSPVPAFGVVPDGEGMPWTPAAGGEVLLDDVAGVSLIVGQEVTSLYPGADDPAPNPVATLP